MIPIILNSNLISLIIVLTELCLLLIIKFSISLSIIITDSFIKQLISKILLILLKFLIFKLLQSKTHLIILLLLLIDVLRVLLINFLILV